MKLTPTAQYWLTWIGLGIIHLFTLYWVIRWAIRGEMK